MDEQVYKGKISFINIEKNFATIEYGNNNKVKSVNFKTDATGTGKKAHQFRLNDHVSFQLKLSDRGDKLAAYDVKFTHNVSLDLLIQKAAIENRFSGYLKLIDEKYYVKEWDSYILFPLRLSPWEMPPVDTAENEPISFKFINLDKPNGLAAELFSHNFLPVYKKALQHFQHQMDTEAVVSRVSPHSVYINLFDGDMQAKLPVDTEKELKDGDIVRVVVTHLSPSRVVVKPVS